MEACGRWRKRDGHKRSVRNRGMGVRVGWGWGGVGGGGVRVTEPLKRETGGRERKTGRGAAGRRERGWIRAKENAWERKGLRLTGERDWLIGILSKEQTERVNFSYHHSINLSLPLCMSFLFSPLPPGMAACQHVDMRMLLNFWHDFFFFFFFVHNRLLFTTSLKSVKMKV